MRDEEPCEVCVLGAAVRAGGKSHRIISSRARQALTVLLLFIYKGYEKREKSNPHLCSTNEFINQAEAFR